LGYKTVFYTGSYKNPKKIAEGPDGMKDIRLAQKTSGEPIYIVTRPQGEKGGRGKIGFTTISRLSELTPKVISEAPIIPKQITDEQWLGANELHILDNGLIGVWGHIARFDPSRPGTTEYKDYYAASFVIDPKTTHISPLEIQIESNDLPPFEAKRAGLENVVFSGGLVRNKKAGKEKPTATAYVGGGDAGSFEVEITDPFAKFEKGAKP
jgi:hypothetical protein